jgi:integrase
MTAPALRSIKLVIRGPPANPSVNKDTCLLTPNPAAASASSPFEDLPFMVANVNSSPPSSVSLSSVDPSPVSSHSLDPSTPKAKSSDASDSFLQLFTPFRQAPVDSTTLTRRSISLSISHPSTQSSNLITSFDSMSLSTTNQSLQSQIIYTNLTPQGIQDFEHWEEQKFSDNSRTNYYYDWNSFTTYFRTQNPNRNPLGANWEDVFSYINYLAKEGYKMSTIERHLSGIASYINFDRSKLEGVIQGMRNDIGKKKVGKDPFLKEHLVKLVEFIDYRCREQNKVRNIDIHDRAFLLFTWYTGMRREELSDLMWDHIKFEPTGILIEIVKSKTDQISEGQTIPINYSPDPRYCTIKALLEWQKISGDGWVWKRINKNDQIKGQLKVKKIYLLIKDYCEKIGLDPTKFSPHSFRAGMITQAVKNGASASKIMKTSRHKSLSTLQTYIRDRELLEDNVSTMI